VWRGGDTGWIVVYSPGPGLVPQRVRLEDPLGDAAAGTDGFVCRPCTPDGAVIPGRYLWRRWPAEIYGTRGEALERCKGE